MFQMEDWKMFYLQKNCGLTLTLLSYLFSPERCFLLVVEFVEVLHVSEDDVLLVDDSWRNLLDSAGHLPQVGLCTERRRQDQNKPIKLFDAVLIWKAGQFKYT